MVPGTFTGLRTRIGLSADQVASEFDIDVALVHRWGEGSMKPPVGVMRALRLMADFSPPPAVKDSVPFTFIDLFAGIGGLRRGFESAGGRCVFTGEWNEYSRRTYHANFPDDDHDIAGNIRQVAASDIPATICSSRAFLASRSRSRACQKRTCSGASMVSAARSSWCHPSA